MGPLKSGGGGHAVAPPQHVSTAPQLYNGSIENGMLVEAGGNMVYLIEDGKKRWVPTAAWINAKGGWNSIRIVPKEKLDQLASGDDLSLFPDGVLIQVAGVDNPVYLVEHGTKRWCPSNVQIDAHGGRGKIYVISQGQLDEIPKGPDLP